MMFDSYNSKDSDSVEDKDKTYECAYIDFDTVLYRSAKSLQEDYIIVKHKVSGRTKEFSGVQKFYGRTKARDGGWIGEQNAKRSQQGKPLISADDYEIITASRLKESPEPNLTILEYGLKQIDWKVGTIKRICDANDYKLGIGGTKPNFRFDAAHIQPYKGQRKEKPILFLELREAFITKYKNKVFIARDGMEMDDEISILGWESYTHYKKTGKHKYVIGFVDKDLKMTPCPHFNYDKPDDGVTIPDVFECARSFAAQCLSGDNTDNIAGLPNLHPDFCIKYGLPKPRGVGKTTALSILESCQTIKEMYERVVEAYRTFYGEDEFEFTSHRGEVSKRTWLDMLQENAILVYMCRSEKEVGKFDIRNTLDRLGVNYK